METLKPKIWLKDRVTELECFTYSLNLTNKITLIYYDSLPTPVAVSMSDVLRDFMVTGVGCD